MKDLVWCKYFVAYIDAAAAASVLYLSISDFIAGSKSAGQIMSLGYWFLVAVLFGLASVAYLRNLPSKLNLHRIAVVSLVPPVVFVIGVGLTS